MLHYQRTDSYPSDFDMCEAKEKTFQTEQNQNRLSHQGKPFEGIIILINSNSNAKSDSHFFENFFILLHRRQVPFVVN